MRSDRKEFCRGIAGEKRKRKWEVCMWLWCGLLMFAVTGCMGTETDREKLQDLEYTVVEDEDLPESFLEEIQVKKETNFKITYKTDEYLYIAMGYGEQETGGYSIQIKELYLTSNAIFFSTELYGPQKGETVTESPSFPYIVVKTEYRQEPVVFE